MIPPSNYGSSPSITVVMSGKLTAEPAGQHAGFINVMAEGKATPVVSLLFGGTPAGVAADLVKFADVLRDHAAAVLAAFGNTMEGE